jgi:hypothetical protein
MIQPGRPLRNDDQLAAAGTSPVMKLCTSTKLARATRDRSPPAQESAAAWARTRRTARANPTRPPRAGCPRACRKVCKSSPGEVAVRRNYAPRRLPDFNDRTYEMRACPSAAASGRAARAVGYKRVANVQGHHRPIRAVTSFPRHTFCRPHLHGPQTRPVGVSPLLAASHPHRSPREWKESR